MDGWIPQLVEKYEVQDRVKFIGKRDDIPELLNIFDMFCLPSIHEGMPLSILEAMACKNTVIVSNVMGINEIINDNRNGMLFENDNENDLANKIEKMLIDQDLKEKLRTNAINYVFKNYNLDLKILI